MSRKDRYKYVQVNMLCFTSEKHDTRCTKTQVYIHIYIHIHRLFKGYIHIAISPTNLRKTSYLSRSRKYPKGISDNSNWSSWSPEAEEDLGNVGVLRENRWEKTSFFSGRQKEKNVPFFTTHM